MATKPFHPSRRLEESYLDALRTLLQGTLNRLGKHRANDWPAILQQVYADAGYHGIAAALSAQMVTAVNTKNLASWRDAARESTRSLFFYNALQGELLRGVGIKIADLVQQNANLISSVPLQLAQQVTAIAAKAQRDGLRPNAVAGMLRAKLPDIAESRVQLIARTEIGKAESALTQTRAQELGLHWYVWRSAEDSRVRQSHRLMDGVIVNWDDPPSPEAIFGERSYGTYAAGCTYSCRCISLPVVNAQTITWPHRVHVAGRIVEMSRKQFDAVGRRLAA